MKHRKRKEPRALPIALILFATLSLSAHAVIGTLDAVPGATVLMPYFEVDPSNTNGVNQSITLHNAGVAPVLAKLSFWTNAGVPTLDFHLFMTGYGSLSFDLRSVFQGMDPTGSTISVGLEDFLAAHQGLELMSSPGQCAGLNLGDGIARGYILIDNVNQESALLPINAGYFEAGGMGIASNDNVLWGEYAYIDPANNFSFAERLVSIEADANDGSTNGTNDRTFYYQYVSGSGADNREPLVQAWSIPFDQSGDSSDTQMFYWRDALDPDVDTFFCGAVPPWFPLDIDQFTVFNAEGQFSNPNAVFALPMVCGRLTPGFEFDLPDGPGQVIIDLGRTPFKGFIDPSYQSVIEVVHSSDGLFSQMSRAIALDPASTKAARR